MEIHVTGPAIRAQTEPDCLFAAGTDDPGSAAVPAFDEWLLAPVFSDLLRIVFQAGGSIFCCGKRRAASSSQSFGLCGHDHACPD